MSLLRTSARAIPRAPPAARQHARALHVENTVNNNFPFKYEKKGTFVAKIAGFLGISFLLPFGAITYQLKKQ
ncbi:hypothetical protein EW145_g7122 [Phellinidium pouzarii]|uniref:Cytochrome c oxidase subunit 8, mitochondrial n=1 Tax=Phellinidium pouzarii TaxID=167371 RepID=A0A4S4KQQ0_9AGAM|nr:hypothetical protein EW145_g7122 [Phellinidium pouzarii]